MAKGARISTLSHLEKFQIAVGIVVSIATVTIGWKTHELTEKANENNAQLKNIEQQLAEAKFGFERVRDIYDRTEKYLSSDKQDERRGRALVVLINSLPNSSLRSDLLSIVVLEATANTVAAAAAEVKQGRDQASINLVDANSAKFIGKLKVRVDAEKYTVETLERFTFVDSNGVSWEVPEGNVFSGASIPRAMWSIIGSPLSGDLIASSVLHEYYSSIRTRPQEVVNKMYYEALLNSGVSEVKAKTVYNAIRVFGPR